jgi:hypothetical protein
MKFSTMGAVVLWVLILGPGASFGNDCDLNLSPCEAYADADAVFSGKVLRISPEVIRDIRTRDVDYDQIAYVSIEKIYKGYAGKKIVLHQWGRKNAPKFLLGSSYLFYANRDPRRQWWVKPCGRTRMSPYVQDDLRYLNSLTKSSQRTRIAGEIVRYESDAENPAGTAERLPGIQVSIKGMGKEYETITDTNGIYEVLDVPPGKYSIQPKMPAGLRLWAALHYGPIDPKTFQSLDVELQPKSCSGLTILLTSANKAQTQ